MKKLVCVALAAAAAFAATSAQAADTIVYNSRPADGWFYGLGGNDYLPSNSAVLTTDAASPEQLYLRMHKTFEVAPASVGDTYNFALGTQPLSFDWGVDAANYGDVTIKVENIGLGQTASYNVFDPHNLGSSLANDNVSANGSIQNSARFNWSFTNVNFDPNVDNTYRVTLTSTGLVGGTRSLSVLAQFGAGAAAVPEPATWAMMIGGFGMVGGAMRRRSAKDRLATA